MQKGVTGKQNRIRKYVRILFRLAFCAVIFLQGNLQVFAAEGFEKASKQGKFEPEAVASYGMTPIEGSMVADGIYAVEVRSSSKYFKIVSAELKVSGGSMQMTAAMDSSAYVCVFPGTGTEAAAAERSAYIDLEKTETGTSFTIDVPALNKPFSCAAFSKKKKRWYDRTLLIDASSLPAGAVDAVLPDYSLLEDALDAYEEEHPDEVKAARDAFFAADGTESPGGFAGTDSDGAGAAGSGQEVAGSGQDSAGSGQEAAGNVQDSTDSSRSDAENPGTEPDQNTDIVISKMDAETMNSVTEAVPVGLADGTYGIEVTMTGGSGRASISSPTWLIVQDGKAFAKLLWSSSYYDYMIVGSRKYLNLTTDGGNSTFIIPVTAMDEPVEVVADTTAMGDPVAIEYVLTFYEDTIGSSGQIPQEAAKKVLISALMIMIAGGVINYFVKKRRTGR